MAFLLVRRHDRLRGRSTVSLGTRLAQEATILFAGGVMVLAGYVGAVWSWLPAVFLILLGVPIMGLVVWLGRGRPSLSIRSR